MRNIQACSTLAVSVLVLAVCSSCGSDPHTIAKLFQRTVVALEAFDLDGRNIRYGSGFFVESDVIATNLHVIEGAWALRARIVGEEEPFDLKSLVAVDRARDLALLRCGRRAGVVLRLLPEGRVPEAGDSVYVCGNPRGFEGSLSQGIVSGLREDKRRGLVQFTASVSTGSSGGPVVNEDGDVVGVVTLSVRDAQNLNFAVSVKDLRRLLGLSRSERHVATAAIGAGRDRERDWLKGLVRGVTTTSDDFVETKIYDLMGNTLESHETRVLSGQSFQNSCRFQYDDDLALMRKVCSDEDCSYKRSADRSELVEACKFINRDYLLSATIVTNDPDGRRLSERYYSYAGVRTNDVSGLRLGFEVDYKYTDDGCLIEEEWRDAGDERVSVFACSPAGAHTEGFVSRNGRKIEVLGFNDHGDLSVFRSLAANAERLVFEYTYDGEGNWTTRTTIRKIGGAVPRDQVTVSTRSLEYFTANPTR